MSTFSTETECEFQNLLGSKQEIAYRSIWAKIFWIIEIQFLQIGFQHPQKNYLVLVRPL